MAKYRKKPIVVEAFQWQGEKSDVYHQALVYPEPNKPGKRVMMIPTLEGQMEASIGDYIITGIKGEVYPCKPDIFEATYEPVGDDVSDDQECATSPAQEGCKCDCGPDNSCIESCGCKDCTPAIGFQNPSDYLKMLGGPDLYRLPFNEAQVSLLVLALRAKGLELTKIRFEDFKQLMGMIASVTRCHRNHQPD